MKKKKVFQNDQSTHAMITDQKIFMFKLSLFIQKHNKNGHHQHNKHEKAIKKEEEEETEAKIFCKLMHCMRLFCCCCYTYH